MAEGRKRKDATGESESSISSVQPKIPRLDVVAPENSTSSASSENSACESSIPDQNLASCCSSNGASVLAKQSSDSVDLEVSDENNIVPLPSYNFTLFNEEIGVTEKFFATSACGTADSGERREKTPSAEVLFESDLPEFTTRRNEPKPSLGSTTTKMPTEDELDKFFAAAEKELQEQFIDKYNYDIVNDQPLEGHYEWIQVHR